MKKLNLILGVIAASTITMSTFAAPAVFHSVNNSDLYSSITITRTGICSAIIGLYTGPNHPLKPIPWNGTFPTVSVESMCGTGENCAATITLAKDKNTLCANYLKAIPVVLDTITGKVTITTAPFKVGTQTSMYQFSTSTNTTEALVTLNKVSK